MLPYARQVLELEKIAKLEGREPEPARDPPQPLTAPSADALCIVCGRAAAGTCERCGSVSYCTREHQRVDATWHDFACDRLCDIREDAAFHRRGARAELAERLWKRPAGLTGAPLSGWDEYFSGLTARHPAERRAVSDLASRPLTLLRVLAGTDLAPVAPTSGTLRIHVMAAAARELEAPAAYRELLAVFPALHIELAFVGPELPDAPLEDLDGIHFFLRASTYGRACWSELGRPHLLVAFNAGLLVYPTWKDTLLALRGSEVPLVITSYRSWEAEAEAKLLASLGAVAVQPPAPNPFLSLAWRRSSTIANDLSQDNAYVSVWRL